MTTNESLCCDQEHTLLLKETGLMEGFMNNTTLEKMQWLADKGLEPDMWRCSGTRDDITMLNTLNESFVAWEAFDWDFDQPYFTESRLWSLLRRILDIKSIDKDYIVIQYRTNNQGELKQTQFSLQDLHTALLDLTIWAVKEGHLKAEVKE